MLKFIFWSLLCINAVLFAYGQGMLGNFRENEREPGRMRNQLGTENIKLVANRPPPPPPEPEAEPDALAEAEVAPAPAPVVPVEKKAPPAPKPELVTCTLVGNFSAADARRFEAMVAPLQFGQRQTRENVGVPEITSHIVFIPSQGSKEAADRRAAQLKELGITNFFIMNDNSPMKYAISLGVFKSEASAQALLATLTKQGVAGAKVAGRSSQATKMAYRFRALEPAAKAKLDAVTARFPAQESRGCK